MKKIPTLFRRNPDDLAHVLPEVTPGCEWVVEGEGVPTRKYDGTCMMFDGSDWWARREVKPGKQAPPGFDEVDHDEVTGKRVGWVPLEQSGFGKFHAEAVARSVSWVRGTYELIGPKINGNPEGVDGHWLIGHGYDTIDPAPPLDIDGLREWLLDNPYEGIVWHNGDRMAKLKRRDFA